MSAEQLLQRAIEVVDAARPMPLSASVMIIKEEVLDLLRGANERLPEELVEARRLLRQRDEVLQRAREDGDAIVRDASARAEQIVQRSEIVRAAEERARRIVAKAEADARSMQMEVEDFCDQRLASFEVTLQRVHEAVRDGRTRLQPSTQVAAPLPGDEGVEPGEEDPFFDREHG